MLKATLLKIGATIEAISILLDKFDDLGIYIIDPG